MRRNKNDNLFQSSNALKVLAYLIDRPSQDALPGEILKHTALSRVGIYLALKQLMENRLIKKQQRGRFVTYTADHDNPIVKQYKIMTNIRQLAPMLERLQALAKKIVLFGSASRGEDYLDSDIDLFVLSQDPEGAANLLSTVKSKRKIHEVIQTPSGFADLIEKNPTFGQEIERGIILWEGKT